jgi:hypothetical protein
MRYLRWHDPIAVWGPMAEALCRMSGNRRADRRGSISELVLTDFSVQWTWMDQGDLRYVQGVNEVATSNLPSTSPRFPVIGFRGYIVYLFFYFSIV